MIIPNSIISNEVIVNSDYIDDKICKWIEIGISYDSDIELAKYIIMNAIIKMPIIITKNLRTLKNLSNWIYTLQKMQKLQWYFQT